jgi:hypothetical protein
MATGTGFECINLKKAKYNRDMKLAGAASAAQVHTSEHLYNESRYAAERTVSYSNNARVRASSRYEDIPADEGYTLKDIADAVERLKDAMLNANERAASQAEATQNINDALVDITEFVGEIKDFVNR